MVRSNAMKSIALALTVACGCSQAARADDARPLDTVRAVMQLEVWYLASESPGETEDPFGDASLKQNFTPAFADAYRAVMDKMKASEEPLIDGDLILNKQDFCPPQDVSLEERSANADQASVAVRLKSAWCFAENSPSEALPDPTSGLSAEPGDEADKGTPEGMDDSEDGLSEESPDEVTEIVFKLVKQDGRWLIDDLDSDGSVRDLLKDLMQE